MPETNVEDFIGELGGGVFREKLAHVLSEVALFTMQNGGGPKKGKVTLTLDFSRINDNAQLMVTHKIAKVVPTKRGKEMMEDTTETPMFVGKGGVMTISPPKEEEDGQFNLREVK